MPRQSTTTLYLRTCHRCGSVVGRDGDPDTVFTGEAWLPGLWPRCGSCVRADLVALNDVEHRGHTKRCPGCKKVKPRAAFGISRNPLSGFSVVCARCNKQKDALKRARAYGVAIEAVSYEKIAQRDGGVCYLCQAPVALADESFDHVVALGNGGQHSSGNVRLAHIVCNVKKGLRTHIEA
jgi:5-methylcytosine-specific restriction endonuclease McrA